MTKTNTRKLIKQKWNKSSEKNKSGITFTIQKVNSKEHDNTKKSGGPGGVK